MPEEAPGEARWLTEGGGEGSVEVLEEPCMLPLEPNEKVLVVEEEVVRDEPILLLKECMFEPLRGSWAPLMVCKGEIDAG